MIEAQLLCLKGVLHKHEALRACLFHLLLWLSLAQEPGHDRPQKSSACLKNSSYMIIGLAPKNLRHNPHHVVVQICHALVG